MVLGARVSGTRWGVRDEMGGRMGLAGHWYAGVGTLLEGELRCRAGVERENTERHRDVNASWLRGSWQQPPPEGWQGIRFKGRQAKQNSKSIPSWG